MEKFHTNIDLEDRKHFSLPMLFASEIEETNYSPNDFVIIKNRMKAYSIDHQTSDLLTGYRSKHISRTITNILPNEQ